MATPTRPPSRPHDATGTTTPLVVLTPPRLDDWMVVDDGVMGGRSKGAAAVEQGHLLFHGTLNTRGGGFSSIRSLSLEENLGPFSGLVLRVKGDGRRYACDLRESARVQGVAATWKAMFDTRAGMWEELRLAFAAFEPTWRGRSIREQSTPSDADFHRAMRSVGFTIADKRDGPFRLLVAAIDGY